MTKKLQRVFRDRPLTADEVAVDQAVRERVLQEFSPQVGMAAVQIDSLSELLRRSLRESSRSPEQIAADADVSLAIVNAFMSGVRDIHLATADKLARALGMEVTTE
jgi:hypothetical protein